MTYLIVYGVPAVAMLVGWLLWSRLNAWLDTATDTEREAADERVVSGAAPSGVFPSEPSPERDSRSVSAVPYDLGWVRRPDGRLRGLPEPYDQEKA